MKGQPLDPWEFVARMLLGVVLGTMIGLERQRKRKMVDVHTAALVAIGATLFAALEPMIGGTISMRVIANIVTGVGFLAGGVILKEGTNVRGLHTAATLWATAAVGALAGVGLEWEAAVAAVLITGTNIILDPIARRIRPRIRAGADEDTLYVLSVDCSEPVEPLVRKTVIDTVSATETLGLDSLGSSGRDDGSVRVRAEVLLPAQNDHQIEKMAHDLSTIAGVTHVAWRIEET